MLLAKTSFCQKQLFINEKYLIASNNHVGNSFYLFFKENNNFHALSLISRTKRKLEFDDHIVSLQNDSLIAIRRVILRLDAKYLDEFTFENNVSFSNGRYIFYHLDEELHYIISQNQNTKVYDEQSIRKLVDYQTSQLSSSSGGIYCIKHYYENYTENKRSKPNLEIKEFLNDSLIWKFELNYIAGDEYSPLIRRNIDIKNETIAILSLSNPEFYLVNKSTSKIDTVKFAFRDSLGNIQTNYVKPTETDVITCNRKLDGYQDIVNNRFRNEKIFFLSDSLIMVTTIAPGYNKKFRNIVIFNSNISQGWTIQNEYIKLNTRDKDTEEFCRDRIALLLTNSINPVFSTTMHTT